MSLFQGLPGPAGALGHPGPPGVVVSVGYWWDGEVTVMDRVGTSAFPLFPQGPLGQKGSKGSPVSDTTPLGFHVHGPHPSPPHPPSPFLCSLVHSSCVQTLLLCPWSLRCCVL